jgi:xanthine dehydrogenase YagR molybdenum-binding subunit
LFVGDFDEEASPLKAKAMGELTAVSVAPAIANAVFHATGKRVRDLPISVEKVL